MSPRSTFRHPQDVNEPVLLGRPRAKVREDVFERHVARSARQEVDDRIRDRARPQEALIQPGL
jgi:hypothetical protein